MLKDGLVRTGLAAALIFVAFALGMLAFTSHALPQEAPSCARPLAMVEDQPGWRVLRGDEAREYMSLMGPTGAMALAVGANAVAYVRLEGKVSIALSRRGCITIQGEVPILHHNRVLNKVLGILT